MFRQAQHERKGSRKNGRLVLRSVSRSSAFHRSYTCVSEGKSLVFLRLVPRLVPRSLSEGERQELVESIHSELTPSAHPELVEGCYPACPSKP